MKLPKLVITFFCFYIPQPLAAFALNANPIQGSHLVTQEIRYHAPEADEVFLVWGINGWNVISEEARPAATSIKKAHMHTPMIRENDTFVIKVKVPSGATLDYGFLITKKPWGMS